MYQGIESFKIWTGIEPPVEVFQKSPYDRNELRNNLVKTIFIVKFRKI